MKRTPLRRRTPLRPKPPKPSRTAEERDQWYDIRWCRYLHTGGRCEADGIHSQHCTEEVLFLHGHGHHVRPTQHGGLDDFDNTRWVHPDCHAQIHSNPAKAKKLGLLWDGTR